MNSIDLIKSRQLQIAPMLDITYSNFRTFIRMITKNALLFTEMINC